MVMLKILLIIMDMAALRRIIMIWKIMVMVKIMLIIMDMATMRRMMVMVLKMMVMLKILLILLIMDMANDRDSVSKNDADH